MTTTTYTADRTALLIVDPYNGFMSEGGKFYETIKPSLLPAANIVSQWPRAWIP